jgi:hypothetical protein
MAPGLLRRSKAISTAFQKAALGNLGTEALRGRSHPRPAMVGVASSGTSCQAHLKSLAASSEIPAASSHVLRAMAFGICR